MDERLSKLENSLARLEVHCETIREDIKLVKSVILGNGKPGVLLRMDRLEQIEDRRKWGVRAGVTALITVIIHTIRQLMY